MILNQILPKGLKKPELSFFELSGMSFDAVRSFLNNLPEADAILGIESTASKDGSNVCFFIESHRADLNLQIIEPKDVCGKMDMECYSIFSAKQSIFPFQMIQQPVWNNVSLSLDDGEELTIQLLFMKKPQERIRDSLWTQYEDYVNGIEQPTSNVFVRSIQTHILEFMKKIEGGYRKHARIAESERKLDEELFSFEARCSIAADSVSRRRVLKNRVEDVFRQHRHVNSWIISKETNVKSFSEHMRLRRFSVLRKQQYLSASELAGFFLTEEPEVVVSSASLGTAITEEQATIEPDTSPFAAFPYGVKQSREHDYKIASQLNKALTKLGLIDDEEVIVQKIQHGSTVKRVTFTLPEGLKLTNLKRAIDDIQTELALSNIGIVQGSNAGTAVLSIPQEERESVFVRDCVEDEAFKKFVKTAIIPILLGKSETGEVVFADLVELKHLLITGSTGSGKSIAINSILTVLLTLVSPNDLKVIMVDPKMVELAAYKKYPHVQEVYTDMSEVEGVLYYLCDLMDERYAKFKEKGYKTIQHYNRNEAVKMPYILLVIDELADLIMQYRDVEGAIIRLAQKARACGILMIIATQRPIREVLTSLIKSNMCSRVCFACDSGMSYRVALDMTPEGFALLGKGDGVYKFEGIQGLHRFQGALIAKTEEEQDRIIDRQSSHWKVKANKDVIDIEASRTNKETKELNEFKKVVLETGETRIMELKKLLNVRNEKVKELLTKLIDIGWIRQHKSRAKGFELLLSEDERKRELERLGGKK